jgi:membrane fusion protein (multidrug efflux system)
VENPDPSLKAGVTVSISLVSKAATPTMYVPTQALIPTPGGYNVYVLSGGKAGYHPVITGLRSENMVEIIKGVNPGDSVLVTGFMKVRPGSRVKITKVW